MSKYSIKKATPSQDTVPPATDINLMERGLIKTLGVRCNPQKSTVKVTVKDLGIS